MDYSICKNGVFFRRKSSIIIENNEYLKRANVYNGGGEKAWRKMSLLREEGLLGRCLRW
jgi:hypothetical protein